MYSYRFIMQATVAVTLQMLHILLNATCNTAIGHFIVKLVNPMYSLIQEQPGKQ